jgi:hypothetical protein
MKHKRHQKDRRDKDDRNHRFKDINNIQYSNTKLNEPKSEDKLVYTMKKIPLNCENDSNHPKKLIIYIVISPVVKHYNLICNFDTSIH